MKKLLSFITVGVISFTIMSSSFAMEQQVQTSNTEKSSIKAQQQIAESKTQIAEKKQQKEQFKAALAEKRQAAQNIKEQNIKLIEENKALRSEIKSILKELKQKNQKLDPALIEKLKSSHESIKNNRTLLSETKGKIKNLRQENKGFIKEMDYEVLEQVFSEIISIKNYRHEKLTEINKILYDILQLLKTISA